MTDGYTLLNSNGEEILDAEGNTRIGSSGDPCCCAVQCAGLVWFPYLANSTGNVSLDLYNFINDSSHLNVWQSRQIKSLGSYPSTVCAPSSSIVSPYYPNGYMDSDFFLYGINYWSVSDNCCCCGIWGGSQCASVTSTVTIPSFDVWDGSGGVERDHVTVPSVTVPLFGNGSAGIYYSHIQSNYGPENTPYIAVTISIGINQASPVLNLGVFYNIILSNSSGGTNGATISFPFNLGTLRAGLPIGGISTITSATGLAPTNGVTSNLESLVGLSFFVSNDCSNVAYPCTSCEEPI